LTVDKKPVLFRSPLWRVEGRVFALIIIKSNIQEIKNEELRIKNE